MSVDPLVRFRATIRIRGVNPYVHVSAARAKSIRAAWRKPLPVLVRVNGEPRRAPWRINMVPAGDGAFYLYLHGDVRRASGTGVGDKVALEVQFDADYRNGPMQPMPAWFRGPLNRSAKAKASWDALIPSRRKEVIRYLSRLKSADARERNVVRMLKLLSSPPPRRS
jgi:hypothetical protein